jgi:hypothetical protein
MEFTLDEAKAYKWLTRHMTAISKTGQAASGKEFTAGIGLQWRASDDGAITDVSDLVHDAVTNGYIACPPGVNVDFDVIADDGDGPGYRWFVTVNRAPAYLTLASLHEEACHLGDPHAGPGVSSAFAVLREALDQANLLLAQLDAYTQATRR